MAYFDLVERINSMFPDLDAQSSYFENPNSSFLKNFILQALLEVSVDVDTINQIQINQIAGESSHRIPHINILATVRKCFLLSAEDIGIFDITNPSSRRMAAIINKMMHFLEFADDRMSTVYEKSGKHFDALNKRAESMKKKDKLSEELNECTLKLSAASTEEEKITERCEELQKALVSLGNEKKTLEREMENLRNEEASLENIKKTSLKHLLRITNEIDSHETIDADLSGEMLESLKAVEDEHNVITNRKAVVWGKVVEMRDQNSMLENHLEAFLKPLKEVGSAFFKIANEFKDLVNEKQIIADGDCTQAMEEKESFLKSLKESLSAVNKQLVSFAENCKEDESSDYQKKEMRNNMIENLTTAQREINKIYQQLLGVKTQVVKETVELQSKYQENMESYTKEDEALLDMDKRLKEEALLIVKELENHLGPRHEA